MSNNKYNNIKLHGIVTKLHDDTKAKLTGKAETDFSNVKLSAADAGKHLAIKADGGVEPFDQKKVDADQDAEIAKKADILQTAQTGETVVKLNPTTNKLALYKIERRVSTHSLSGTGTIYTFTNSSDGKIKEYMTGISAGGYTHGDSNYNRGLTGSGENVINLIGGQTDGGRIAINSSDGFITSVTCPSFSDINGRYSVVINIAKHTWLYDLNEGGAS